MTVKFPFWANDAAKLIDLLLWIKQLGGCKGHSALLIADAGVDYKKALEVKQAALRSFDRCEIVTTEETCIGWPYGPNQLFLTALAHDLPQGGPWLWMETDCVPMHRDWLTIIEAELGNAPAICRFYPCDQPPFPPLMASGIAAFNKGPHMARIREATFNSQWQAFDVSINQIMLDVAKNTTRIQHLWGENKDAPPTFDDSVMPRPRGFMTTNQIEGGVVLFHRNKDGSLIKKLRQQMNIALPVTRAVAPATPALPRPKLIVRRSGALGDVLAASCVVTKLEAQGYEVEYQAHASTHCMLRRMPHIRQYSEPNGPCDINLDGAYESDPNRRVKHFAEMFIDSANRQLRSTKIPAPTNFAPRMEMADGDYDLAFGVMSKHPRPWTVIVPRSNNWPTRTVPDHIWQAAASKIVGTKFWLGNHGSAPWGIVDLNCRHFDHAIAYLGVADVVVGPDTGPIHVAAALGTPVVAIQQQHSTELSLSNQRDFEMISPHLSCLNCCTAICPINSHTPPCQNISNDLIASTVNAKLHHCTTEDVSVVIVIHKPTAERLNRCLSHVLHQVQEVVICHDSASFVPRGVTDSPKIRFVKANGHDLGYGKKANVGARHTNGKYILMLNDDCFLAPNAVEKLLETIRIDESIGMVGHLLRYPNGEIQHAGMFRATDGVGFGHLDLKAREGRIKEPTEVEAVTGASILLRRKAYFDINGHDEDYWLYAEDTDACMAMRQNGWKIYYTPHAEAIHEEHASSSLRPEVHLAMQKSNQHFGNKWRFYWEVNRGNQGLGVFQ